MKKIKLILFMMIVSFLFTTCRNSIGDLGGINEAALKSASDERMIPFRAVFQSHGADDAFTSSCGEEIPTSSNFWLLDHQVGEGNALHMGNIYFNMTFCFHFVFDESGGFDFENGFGEVKDGDGYFEAANGDRLFITAPIARVLQSEIPGIAYFDDTFYFNGGTGNFEGAHGEFNAYGTLPQGGPTDHIWEGTLYLPKAVKANK